MSSFRQFLVQFRTLFAFEVGYHLRRPLFWLVAFFFGLIAWGATVSDAVQIGGSIGNVHRNAPFVILQMLVFLTPIGTFVTTAFVASAALRDFELGTAPLFFSKPIGKGSYLLGRFLGAYLISCLVFVGPALGLLIGSFMPWLDPERLGPTMLSPYIAGFAFFILPTMLFLGATFYVVASLTRSWLYTYLGVILFFVGFFLSRTLRQDIENETIASLLDPFGLGALAVVTQYWTVVEQNAQVPELAGPLLWNRLLWFGASLLVLAVGLVTFSTSERRSRRKKKKDAESSPRQVASETHDVPRVAPSFDSGFFHATGWRQFLRIARYETVEVLRSVPFLVILAFGLFNLIAGADFMDRIFGTPVHPVTHLMWQQVQGSYAFLLLIILTFYAGELVWRERGHGNKDVFDALPTPNASFLAAKTVALVTVVLTFLATGVIAAIGIQLYRGFTNIELDVYAASFAVDGLFFVLACFLAIFFQVISNHKFVGFLLMIVYMLSLITLDALDFTHNLYRYGATPPTPYSDMNGYGHTLLGVTWFGIYWSFVALGLMVLAALFWVRGHETAARFRVRLARDRFRGPVRVIAAVAIAGVLGTGAWIFYNTNILNEYVTPDEAQDRAAEYEKKYRQYKEIDMPHITAVSTEVDIFPYERRIEARGTYTLVNEHEGPIRELHWNLDPAVELRAFELPPHEVRVDDEILGYRIVELDDPIQPGESFEVRFDVVVDPQGFPNGGTDTQIVYNGTFFNNRAYFPVLGYQTGRQLVDRNERRKRDLEPVERMAKIDDEAAWEYTYLGKDADWIDFETTVSTAADQIALAPGYLQEEWTEGDRRYFRYEMDAPILHFYSYLSARWEVLRDSWTSPEGQEVAIEIYYHPGHEYNLDRMVESVQHSLTYFSEAFGPYQHRQVRIVEFPRYAQFAQSFPNTIPFSESIGFIARLDDDPDAIDYVYYVTSHEVAHQWWAHQVIGANVQGATLLSETLSQYSALMVMREKYGEEKMSDFLDYELDRYLRGRGGELVEEMPLMLVENQQYIHYRKGSVVMYALQDLVGEDTLNRAIRAYADEVRFQEPPFTTTRDLMAHIREVVPPEYQETVTDLFERITLFENKVEEATYTELADGTYRVRLETSTRKVHADGEGVESDAPLDDWVDIGVFAEAEDGGDLGPALFLETRRLTDEENVFEVVVAEKPAKAGIDPYVKRVDRNSDNNVKTLQEAEPGESSASD